MECKIQWIYSNSSSLRIPMTTFHSIELCVHTLLHSPHCCTFSYFPFQFILINVCLCSEILCLFFFSLSYFPFLFFAIVEWFECFVTLVASVYFISFPSSYTISFSFFGARNNTLWNIVSIFGMNVCKCAFWCASQSIFYLFFTRIFFSLSLSTSVDFAVKI